jgi:hypothetical protein
MNRDPIPSITLAFGTGDGQLLSVTHAHTINGKNVAQRVSAADIDAYVHTPVCGKPGIYLEIITKEGPDHNIPLPVWNTFFSLLRMQLHASTIIRNSSIIEETEDLGSSPPASSFQKKAILTTIPTGCPLESITINGDDLNAVLARVMPADKAQSIVDGLCSGDASHGDMTILTKPDPTYDPHYKDSDIPDDIHLYESDEDRPPF